MNTIYLYTERRNFKTFWKESFAIGLDSCYLFNIEHETGHDIDQKQPSRGVPWKRCSENMQQIYRKTPMPKCDFNKVAKQLY